jgi:hypothetical protein
VGEITPDAVAAVLRRAAEIEADRAQPDPVLDTAVLAEIGRELGLSADSVGQAMREWQRGELAAEPAALSRRVLGLDAGVTVERELARETDEVRTGAQRWLSRQLLERRRDSGPISEWAPRRGVTAQVQRGVDLNKRLRLNDVDRLRLTVRSGPAGGSAVRVEADLGGLRRGLLTGVVAVPLALGVVGGIAAIDHHPTLLAAPPVGAAVATAGWVGSRRTLDRRSREVAENIQLALDDVAAGVAGPPAVSDRVTGIVTDTVGSITVAGGKVAREVLSRWQTR